MTAHNATGNLHTTLADALFQDLVYDPTNTNATSTTLTITGLNPSFSTTSTFIQ